MTFIQTSCILNPRCGRHLRHRNRLHYRQAQIERHPTTSRRPLFWPRGQSDRRSTRRRMSEAQRPLPGRDGSHGFTDLGAELWAGRVQRGRSCDVPSLA